MSNLELIKGRLLLTEHSEGEQFCLPKPDLRKIIDEYESLLNVCKMLVSESKTHLDFETMQIFGPIYVAALKAIAKSEEIADE